MSNNLLTPAAVTYAVMRGYLQPRLEARGWNRTNGRVVSYSPGPSGDPLEQKITAQRAIFLDIGGGPGLALEATYDRVMIGARFVGPQKQYDEAEALALGGDAELVAFGGSADLVPGLRGLFIDRAGGRPTLLLKDNAERYHFTASYIVAAESGFF